MKKFIKISLLSLCLLSACSTKSVTSHSSTSSRTKSSSISSEVNYVYHKDVSYGNAERNIFDICIPNEVKCESIVMYIHGGSWVSGDKKDFEEGCKTLASQGIPCATMNYRYADANTTCLDILDDVTACLTKIVQFGNENNISFKKMALMGHSAGGHLSLLYSYKMREVSPITPKFVVSLAGPTDLTNPDYFNLFKDKAEEVFTKITGEEITKENQKDKEDILKEISPLYYVDENSVPTLICQGELDSIVPPKNSHDLYQKLLDYNVPTTYISFPKSNHGLGLDSDSLSQFYVEFGNYINNYLL